jgi:hypothetical protein
MSLGPDGFVILFLSTLIPFSGTLHLSVNQALSRDKEMKKPFPLAPHFSAIISCKHLAAESFEPGTRGQCHDVAVVGIGARVLRPSRQKARSQCELGRTSL